MSWNLSCRKVRHSLALLSGNDRECDLDSATEATLKRHLSVCPLCREEWQRLQTGQQTLEEVRSNPKPLHASVWPAVEEHLLAGNLQPVPAESWRGWLPTGALAAACLTLFLIALPMSPPSYPREADTAGSPPVIFSQSVGAPVYRLDESPRFERRSIRHGALPLPDVPRVRILLDGTDVRGL